MDRKMLANSSAEKDAWLSNHIKKRVADGALLCVGKMRDQIKAPWAVGDTGKLSSARIKRVMAKLQREGAVVNCPNKMDYGDKLVKHWRVINENKPAINQLDSETADSENRGSTDELGSDNGSGPQERS